MIAKVEQNGSIMTIEFTSTPTADIVSKVKAMGMVRQTECTFKGINNDEHKAINALNAMGVSVSTPDGYMGAHAWYGAKSHLYGADLVKAIRADLKQAGIKATVRKDRSGFTGHITVTVTATEDDFLTFDEYRKNYDFANVYWFYAPQKYGGILHARYVYDSNDNYTDEQRKEIMEYHVKFEYDYEIAKTELQTGKYCKKMNDIVNDNFEKKLKLVQAILDSYNYNESNSMVDYFSVGFYDDIKIKNMKAIQAEKTA